MMSDQNKIQQLLKSSLIVACVSMVFIGLLAAPNLDLSPSEDLPFKSDPVLVNSDLEAELIAPGIRVIPAAGLGKFGINSNAKGGILELDGVTYQTGLSAENNATFKLLIDGKSKIFTARCGFDSNAQHFPNVSIFIHTWRKENPEFLASIKLSEKKRSGTIRLPLKGLKTIGLLFLTPEKDKRTLIDCVELNVM